MKAQLIGQNYFIFCDVTGEVGRGISDHRVNASGGELGNILNGSLEILETRLLDSFGKDLGTRVFLQNQENQSENGFLARLSSEGDLYLFLGQCARRDLEIGDRKLFTALPYAGTVQLRYIPFA